MRKLPLLFILGLFAVAFGTMVSCTDDADGNDEWRKANSEWLARMQARTNADGTPYYKVIVPDWDPGNFVLVHYFNDREENKDKLSPIYTSVIDVRYNLHLYNDVAVDSSTTLDTWGPGIYRAQLNKLVPGWAAAICDMHVGDTAEVIVPYQLAYGSTATSSMPGYSNLRFNIRLHDIYKYEASPY